MTLLSSERFEVTIEGTHGIVLPDSIVAPFVKKGLKRVNLWLSLKVARSVFMELCTVI